MNLPLKWTAAIVLSLFTPAWSSAATVSLPCLTLSALVAEYRMGQISEDPLKPQNVEARALLESHSRYAVYWTLPSNRSTSTITGHYVHFTHEASGETRGYSRSGSDTSFAVPSCVTGNRCTGTFLIKVKLQNDCGLLETYSDSISHNVEE